MFRVDRCLGSNTCSAVVEVDAPTVYNVVGRLLDCIYRLRRSCGSLTIESAFWVAGRDGREEWYAVAIDGDLLCRHGVLGYVHASGLSLAMLADPLRGEGLVRLGEKLYVDKALAECISRGGRCGGIELVPDDDRRGCYIVRVCGAVGSICPHVSEEWGVRIVRVLDADSLSPSMVVDAARGLGESLQKLDVDVYCDFLRIHAAVRPGMETGRYVLTVSLDASKTEVASLETSALLYALACLAKAGLIEHRAK